MLSMDHIHHYSKVTEKPGESPELLSQKRLWLAKAHEHRDFYARLIVEMILDVFGFDPDEPHPGCTVHLKYLGRDGRTSVKVDASNDLNWEHDVSPRVETDNDPNGTRNPLT
jgi:hypothetical protein